MKVFLSHSSSDKPFVREFNRILNVIGIETFLDERDIKLGESIPPRIYKEISEVDRVFYFISKISIKSKWVEEELSIAKMREKQLADVFVLPILIDKIEELPYSIIDKRYADFCDRSINIESENFKLVLKALEIDIKEFYVKFGKVKSSESKELISNTITFISELQIDLNDISYLVNRTIYKQDNYEQHRKLTIKEELDYRNVNYKLGVLIKNIDKLKEYPFMSNIFSDFLKRISNFFEVKNRFRDFNEINNIDKQTLHMFNEVIISFNRILSSILFHLSTLSNEINKNTL